jgi:hypothetical protein
VGQQDTSIHPTSDIINPIQRSINFGLFMSQGSGGEQYITVAVLFEIQVLFSQKKTFNYSLCGN